MPGAGPAAGLRLGRDSADISLMEIVTCFDGDALFEECALGLPNCSQRPQMPGAQRLGMIREHDSRMVAGHSLSEFPGGSDQSVFDRARPDPSRGLCAEQPLPWTLALSALARSLKVRLIGILDRLAGAQGAGRAAARAPRMRLISIAAARRWV